MLTRLFIQNYALIDQLNVDFSKGLTTITGETGAGKSILLGGLGLILGNRADLNAMMDSEKKCVIEGEFNIAPYHLQHFFAENDLDYEPQTVIRRELLPGGKSRAFINDSPVRLELLSELQNQLIDVHSQHQTLQINEQKFQFSVIDTLSDTLDLVEEFKVCKANFEKEKNYYQQLKLQIEEEKKQADYHYHLFRELEMSSIKQGEVEILENESQRLSHIDLIQNNLNESYQLLTDENFGINSRLFQVKNALDKIKSYSDKYQEFHKRIDSVYIELVDFERELAILLEKETYSPEEFEKVNARLLVYQNLFQKHKVSNENELLEIYNELDEKVKRISDSENVLRNQSDKVDQLHIDLTELGIKLHEQRKKHLPEFEKEITAILHQLGMNQAVFEVKLEESEKFNSFGMDQMEWQFSANKGNKLGLVQKVASGGELSRIMLAIKSILARKANLPTIIFDEIDTGISGEVAIKMGEIMKKMSDDIQVICITHLPQIAAKGEQHLKVYKEDTPQKTQTQLKKLDENQRLQELAEMLGGKQISESALNHAAELLQLKK